MLSCMHRIKAISRIILDEKLEDTAVGADDMHTKKDIMSLLVKARMSEANRDSATDAKEPGGRSSETGPSGYRMSDEMIMNQVVSRLCLLPLRSSSTFREFS